MSRLVGFYHLWPHVIPYPDISEVVLSPSDRFFLMANDQLWQALPCHVVEKIITGTSSPSYAAKKLRDAAIAFGCKGNISLLLLKFNQRKLEELIGSRPVKRPRSAHRSVSLRIPEDTHHYRLEVDTPAPLVDFCDGDDLHEVDEVTDIDALSYGSPEHEKWTNLDEPISPLTPPPGFGFEGDEFVSSTPSRPPVGMVAKPTQGHHNEEADVGKVGLYPGHTKRHGNEDSAEVFKFDEENSSRHIIASSLPDLLEPDSVRDKFIDQQFYFCNSEDL